jgi:hypothetical protein
MQVRCRITEATDFALPTEGLHETFATVFAFASSTPIHSHAWLLACIYGVRLAHGVVPAEDGGSTLSKCDWNDDEMEDVPNIEEW